MITFDYEITKENVLNKFSEQDIIEHYVGSITLDKMICSPLRKDKNPSFSFRRYGDKILWRDWAKGETGDAFNLVQKIYNCNFYDALKRITEDMGSGSCNFVKQEHIKEERVKKSASIIVQRQGYTLTDLNYWSQFGIRLSTLIDFEVYSALYVWIGGEISYIYRHGCPVYEYHISDTVKQIYSPLDIKRRKFRFNGNNSSLLGERMLPWLGEVLILTKAMKEVMCLRELGVVATSFVGETTFNEEILQQLKKRFNKIIIFYDNDETGIESSRLLSDTFDLEYYNFCEIGLEDKNISDFIKRKGIEEARKLIKTEWITP